MAHGKGVYVSKEIIYKGEFYHGVPHGWGLMQSKDTRILGNFEQGVPEGEIMEENEEGLFIGFMRRAGGKYGRLIRGEVEEKVNEVKQDDL